MSENGRIIKTHSSHVKDMFELEAGNYPENPGMLQVGWP